VFIHPWDAALSEAEWREWLGTIDRFGVLAVNNLDPMQAPLVLPTHFTLLGDEIVFHLARPNPVWQHLLATAEVRLAVAGDFAYIPGYWRTDSALHVPTSYYASVQFVCRPEVVDDRSGKEAILLAQMADFQPEGGHEPIGDYHRMLPGIRGLRLKVLRVEAKFKYDDEDSVESREHVNAELVARNEGLDARAAAQQRRRIEAVGTWRP
jgi:transcriptional regulator